MTAGALPAWYEDHRPRWDELHARYVARRA